MWKEWLRLSRKLLLKSEKSEAKIRDMIGMIGRFQWFVDRYGDNEKIGGVAKVL